MDAILSASGSGNVPCMGLKSSDFARPSAHYQLVPLRGWRFLILLAQGAGAEFSVVFAFCFGWMAS